MSEMLDTVVRCHVRLCFTPFYQTGAAHDRLAQWGAMGFLGSFTGYTARSLGLFHTKIL